MGSDDVAAGGADARSGSPPDEQLLELLREMEARDGRVKAAETLGVNFRTLQQAADTGVLSARMEDALKRRLLEEGRVAPAAGRLAALERRQDRLEAALKALAKELGAQLSGISAELAALREAAPGPEQPEEPDGLGTERKGAAPNAAARPPAPAVRGVAEPVIGRKPATKPRRAHPDLVTLEPEEGEELVYGEEATPLIGEWREARAAFIDRTNSRVERATAWVRMCERAVTLIGEYELTLPLADYPWDKFERRRELGRSEESLRDARRELTRARCWRFLRRALTFGQWRR